jgi:hypothetical protein
MEEYRDYNMRAREVAIPDSKIKPVNMERRVSGFFDFKGRIARFYRGLTPEKTYLINMELRNGKFSMFAISTNEEYFIHLGHQYIIDDDLKYYIVEAKCYCLDYHQDLALPIRRKVPLNDIRNILEKGGIIDIETAINPANLSRFQISNVIEKVLKGQEIDTMMRMLRLLTIISLLMSGVNLLILLNMSGVLKGLTGGG